jgi:hypothetical protein
VLSPVERHPHTVPQVTVMQRWGVAIDRASDAALGREFSGRLELWRLNAAQPQTAELLVQVQFAPMPQLVITWSSLGRTANAARWVARTAAIPLRRTRHGMDSRTLMVYFARDAASASRQMDGLVWALFLWQALRTPAQDTWRGVWVGLGPLRQGDSDAALPQTIPAQTVSMATESALAPSPSDVATEKEIRPIVGHGLTQNTRCVGVVSSARLSRSAVPARTAVARQTLPLARPRVISPPIAAGRSLSSNSPLGTPRKG